MPSVKYFLDRQPNGFYSGSVLEEVDEKGDPKGDLTVAKKYLVNSHGKSEVEGVVPTDKQADYLIGIPSDVGHPTGRNTNPQEEGTLVSLVQEKESAPPTSASVTGSSAIFGKVSESVMHHLQAWNLGQELQALHLSISTEPYLASHHSRTMLTAGDVTADEGSSNSSLNSHILVLHYGLEKTNIATGGWPSLVIPEVFTAFGVSTNSSISHLIQSIDFMSVAASEQNRPQQLILWFQDNHNEWIPSDVWTLNPTSEMLTLEDMGWKGGVDNHVRISLLGWPYCLKFQNDVGKWKVS